MLTYVDNVGHAYFVPPLPLRIRFHVTAMRPDHEVIHIHLADDLVQLTQQFLT